jgi:type II secretory pathway component GspD/PulD (secretin)
MTCEECLAELATGSLREMADDSQVMEHCATCPDCSRLTTLLREREYNAANVLNNLPPMNNPITVAEASVSTAHRRRIGQVVVMLSGAALVVTIWIAAAVTIFPKMRHNDNVMATLRTETIPLSCLSPSQAADIINPYIRSRSSAYYLPTSGISAITVRGTAEELVRSRNLLRDFENDPAAACHNKPADMLKSDAKLSNLQRTRAAGSATVPDKVPTAPARK